MNFLGVTFPSQSPTLFHSSLLPKKKKGKKSDSGRRRSSIAPSPGDKMSQDICPICPKSQAHITSPQQCTAKHPFDGILTKGSGEEQIEHQYRRIDSSIPDNRANMASLPGRAGGGGGSDRDNADKNCKKKLPPARDDEGERETSPKRSRPINLPFTPPPRAPYTGGIPVFNPPRRPREPARRADFADADNDEQLSEYFVANRHRTRPIDIPSGGRRREEEGSDGEGKDWPPLAHSPGTGMMEILAMSPASRLLAQGLARQSPALRTRRRVVSDAVGFPAPIAGDVFYSPAGVREWKP
ncbi:hypothetical protein B0T26DRAFT_239116 [Lasiosphaeria miniovina]|uniref:Uncharacterized protein n=1 Tax=Lasiosphaeria miniovina TaxID=1954250 RepID=A0AA40AVT4_9PEZI|nr:uncharacterized protein B0T26DRAFT_239116 [Lasiosphaeria miniovina]KAK0722889.1 hypothetical protein B0T26DRAFT_239116 [Lasiosphaeria miniovina]